MKLLIQKRNYIIIFIIFILLIWIINNDEKAFIKSYDYKGDYITINIYEKERYEKIDKKIKNIIKSFKLNKEKLKNDLKKYDEYFEKQGLEKIDVDSKKIENAYLTEQIIKYFKKNNIKKYIINNGGNISAGLRYSKNKYSISLYDDFDSILDIISLENESLTHLDLDEYNYLFCIGNNSVDTIIVNYYLYKLDISEGKKFARNFKTHAYWIYNNKNEYTDGFKKHILKK